MHFVAITKVIIITKTSLVSEKCYGDTCTHMQSHSHHKHADQSATGSTGTVQEELAIKHKS